MSLYFAGFGGNVEFLGQIEPCSSAEEMEYARIADLEGHSSSKSMGAANSEVAGSSVTASTPRDCTDLLLVTGNRCFSVIWTSRIVTRRRQSLLLSHLDLADCLSSQAIVTSD